MQKADIAVPMQDVRYPGVKAGILNWPVSAVRLVGRSSQQMQTVANNILTAWRDYSDESVGIWPTPTARPTTPSRLFCTTMRRTATSWTWPCATTAPASSIPDGIFHPHKEYHNIKKENIGLIEVMGLAILPARLKDQGAPDAEILSGPAPEHQPRSGLHPGRTRRLDRWADCNKYGTGLQPEEANEAVKAGDRHGVQPRAGERRCLQAGRPGSAAFVRFM